MIWNLIFINTHFVITQLMSVVAFVICWLYWDSLDRKNLKKSGLFVAGWFLVGLSFAIEAVGVFKPLIEIVSTLRLSGVFLLFLGQMILPLQPVPTDKPKDESKLIFWGFLGKSVWALPITTFLAAYGYIRRATIGLENHLKPVGLGLGFLSLYELVGLSYEFSGTDNINIYNLVKQFGPIWIAQKILLLVTVLVLGKWVWGYLLKRFETQIFLLLTISTLSIFLITTTSFTFSTLKQMSDSTYKALQTDARVLEYAIVNKKDEISAGIKQLANDPKTLILLNDKNYHDLKDTITGMLVTKRYSSLVVLSKQGEILVRGEDNENIGGSLSENKQVKKAIAGEESVSLETHQGVNAPIVSIASAVPINGTEGVTGVILARYDIDNSFVDGVKKATGLEASIYGEDLRSATTFLDTDGHSRYIGIKEENKSVVENVLRKGEIFVGEVNILNSKYSGVYLPLLNEDKNPVGMLFVGKLLNDLIITVNQASEMTFAISGVLILLSLIPSITVARYISYQIK